ncbi:MAG: SIS domain-containing protein [Chlamydiales bacterium]
MFIERLDELTEKVRDCVYTTQEGVLEPDDALTHAQNLLQTANHIYVIGNGGSAGIASHFCTDLLKTLSLPALTFSDSNILTCFANDYGYEEVYRGPLLRHLQSRDLLVAISSSGQSENILRACQAAHDRKASIITLSGFVENNPLRSYGNLNFWIDSQDYGIVETAHFFLLHTLIDSLSSCKEKSRRLAKLVH